MQNLFLCAAFFFLFHPFAKAQDSLWLARQYANAQQLMDQQDYPAAINLAQTVQKNLERAEPFSAKWYALFLSIESDCALEEADFPKAMTLLNKAQKALDTLSTLAEVEQAEIYHKFGNYHFATKNLDRALEYYERALALRIKNLDPIHLKVADSYNNIGNLKNELGDYDTALAYHDKAMSIRQSLLEVPHPSLAQSRHNIGLCLQNKGEYTLAKLSYQKAIQNYVLLYGPDHAEVADVYLNLGGIYSAEGDLSLFLEKQEQALQIYQKTLEPGHPKLGTVSYNLANAYVDAGNFDLADTWYERALDNQNAHFGLVHPEMAKIWLNWGVSQYLRGDGGKAIDYFQQCFQALNYQAEDASGFETINDPQTLLQLLWVSGKTYWDYAPEAEPLSAWEAALDYFSQADLFMDHLRTQFETTGSKLELADEAHFIYGLAIELCFQMYFLTESKVYLEKAFHFSEKSKGILLLAALQDTKAEQFSGIPPVVIDSIQELENKITELEKSRFYAWGQSQEVAGQSIDSLSNLIFDYQRKLQRRMDALEKAFPEYYNLRYATATLSIPTIQQNLLRPQQSMLEYFLGDSVVYVFVINQEDFSGHRLVVGEALLQVEVEDLHTAIRSFPNVPTNSLENLLNQYIDGGFTLYQQLIFPLEQYLKKELIIVPDGVLSILPFAALLSERPQQVQAFSTHPYLVHRYRISYTYSASLLQEMQTHKKHSGLKSYLGIAPVFSEGRSLGLTPLRYNQEEVQRMHELLGGDLLLAKEATKAQFIKQQAGYRILHLATHGKANSASGDFSFLAFAQTKDAQNGDQQLFVREIYNLKTEAEMVVLSACETGIGELLAGEGMASIARSFSYAGAQSLIATQWSVDDQTTQQLIQLFLQGIKKGLSKDRALQKAQASFIGANGNRLAHPYYWASLIPIGDMEPLSFGPSKTFKIVGGLILLSLLGFSLFWYFKRKKAHYEAS